MINRNISTKIFSVRYVSQVIVPCYYCVPDQHFSAMGNCEESAGWKKDCHFFQIKVKQFNISTSGICKSEYDYLCMSTYYTWTTGTGDNQTVKYRIRDCVL